MLGLFKPLERVAFGDKNYPNCDTSTSFFRPLEAGRFIKSDSLMGDAFYVTLVDKKKQIRTRKTVPYSTAQVSSKGHSYGPFGKR